MEISNFTLCILIISAQIILSLIVILVIRLESIYFKTRLNLLHDSFVNYKNLLQVLTEQVATISNKQDQLSESLPKSNNTNRRLPTPEEEEQITLTIKDYIATEVSLASGLRSPYKDSLKDIVLKTVETYPEIDIEYIARKVVSMVELYSK